MTHVESEANANTVDDREAAAKVLEGIVRAVVHIPEQVAVESSPEADGALLTLRVASSDLDRITGAGGRTARSLRMVLTALGRRSGQRFSLDIQSHTP